VFGATGAALTGAGVGSDDGPQAVRAAAESTIPILRVIAIWDGRTVGGLRWAMRDT